VLSASENHKPAAAEALKAHAVDLLDQKISLLVTGTNSLPVKTIVELSKSLRK